MNENISQDMENYGTNRPPESDDEFEIYECYICGELIDEGQEVWKLANPQSKLAQPCHKEC